MLDYLKLTVLMADRLSEQKALSSHMGYAFLVETELKRLFFNFGATSRTLKNAMRLDAVFGPIDYAVLSHGAWDHGSGFPAFVKDGLKSHLYAGPHCFYRKYKKEGYKYSDRGLSFSRFYLDRVGRDLHEVEGLVKLTKGMSLLQGFPLVTTFEAPPSNFFKETRDDMVPDDFQDELCMVFETQTGLVVLIAEALRGLINVLEHVQQTFNQPIRAVVTELRPEVFDAPRLHLTLEALKDYRLELFATPTALTKEQAEAFHDVALHVCELGVGDCLLFR